MAYVNCDYYSYALKGYVSLSAFLPLEKPSFSPDDSPLYSDRLCRTLYFLHGFAGNVQEILYGMGFGAFMAANNIAVIMPFGGNNFWIDNEVREELYGDFVSRELVGVTRSIFPLSRNREDTYIGGISMGGYGALVNGLAHNDTFSKIAALSPALITDEVSQLKPGERNMMAGYSYYANVFGDLSSLSGSSKDPKHLAKTLTGDCPEIFLTCGTEDFLYGVNEELHEHLDDIGYAHTWVTRPGMHDPVFWNGAAEGLAKFLG
jgi:S-formylglutathione hydrolase FrmB